MESTIHALGQAAFNMSYADFCATLSLEDDSYARDKYADLKTLARAMAPFTDTTLTQLAGANAAASDTDPGNNDDKIRALAVERWAKDGEIEFDDGAIVSGCEDGAYVQAWVWVDFPDNGMAR